MPREPSKSRAWEKERRNRLAEAFGALCKTLPCYDPSIPTPKIEILRNATTHIEDLQSKIKELTSSTTSSSAAEKFKDEEFKNLQRRVKRLLTKHELLCNLLRDAKIPIPKGCGIISKRLQQPLKWSNSFLPQQVKILQKKEAEKENEEIQPRKFIQKPKNKIGIQNGTPKHRKAILNRTEAKKVVKKKKLKTGTSPKCVIVLSQPSITQPYYVITNTSSNILGNNLITSSGLVSNPVVSTKPSKSVSSISSLGPGTLILANGTIMPVLPQQTVLPVIRPPLILVPKTQATKTDASGTCTATKNLVRLRPKYCLTKTTQVNKVPIPALTSRYSNKDLICKSKVEEKVKKVKEQEKKIVATVTDEKTDKVSDTTPIKEKVAEELEKIVETKEQIPQEVSQKDKDLPVEALEEPKTVEPEPPSKLPQPEEDQQVLTKKVIDDVDLNINHSELSNDIFASLQVPSGCQNPESTSPTAAFLLAFPLVSSLTGVKVTEVAEEDNTESQRETPTLLQIGAIDTTKPTQSERPTFSESLTPSLLNLDNLSFFSSKEMSGFYNSFEGVVTTSSVAPAVTKNYNSFAPSVTSSISKNFGSFESAAITNLAKSSVAATTTTPVTTVYNSSSTNCSFNGPKSATTRLNPQASDKPDEKKINFQNQQRHLIPELPTCFEQKNSIAIYDNINSGNYHAKPKPQQQQQQQQQQPSCNPVYPPPIQKSFCNNLEVSKMTTYPIKSYPEPLYTNSNTSYSYSYNSDSNFNQGYYKNFPKSDNRSYYPLTYDNYSNFTSTATTTSNYYTNSYKISGNHSTAKNKTATNGRPPINWMTTPDKTQTDYNLPQLNRDNEFSTIYSSTTFTNPQTTYFNTNPVYHEANNKTTFDLPLVPAVNSYQRNENEDNQFSWSPTKIPQFLEPSHNFVSSTLPTLVGDLALGNPLGFGEQKIDTSKNQKKENCRRLKGYEGSGQNHSNFLSVSQLVDHGKEVVPARTTARRNSGNRSSSGKNKMVPAKVPQRKEKVESSGGFSNRTKNSYSAEALIGHQIQPGDQNQKSRNQSYPTTNKPLSVPPFLHDNIMPYFPSMDLPSQDNTYMQQNQNYHNFSNNAYSTNSFIPSTTTYNFMHDMSAPHDLTDNIFSSKNCHSNNKTVNNKSTKHNDQQCPPPSKKSKRKHSNDLPGFVDFPFLSMPSSINSPILPDDFHTHTSFLQPPTSQLYPCKNPFTKPNDLGSTSSLLPLPPVGTARTNIHNPEISPSLNNAGTSFANFNLCTIIPEINAKTAVPEPYGELTRVKEQSRNYSSVAQVSFNNKSTLSFSYINHTTSQTYNNQ